MPSFLKKEVLKNEDWTSLEGFSKHLLAAQQS